LNAHPVQGYTPETIGVRAVANPQTERGFVMLALDVFAALVVADLPKREWIVLSEVLMVCYGHRKRRDVFLDPISIEDYSGLHRNNARRAIAALVAKGILHRNANGSYRFEKDWEAWRTEAAKGAAPGELVADRDCQYAGAVVDRLGIPKESIKKAKKVAIQRDIASTSGPIPLDMPDAGAGNPTGLRPTKVGQSNGIGPDVDASDRGPGRNPISGNGLASETGVEPPLDERAPAPAELDSRAEILEGRDVGVITPTPPACEPVVDRHGEIIDVDCGVVNDPAEVERVAEWAVQAFNGFHWGTHVRNFKATYPIAWIELALQNAAAWPTPPRAFTPVLNELRRWHLAGGPPAIVTAPAPPAAGPTPSAPPSRLAQKLRDQHAGMDTWDF
jgi:hypothetical protein